MSISEFLSCLFNELNKRHISYLIERNYEQLPQYTSNDVDFLVSDSDTNKFITAVMKVISRLKMKVILFTTAYGGGRIYLFRPKNHSTSIIRIDFMTDIHFSGIPLLNAQIILQNRHKRNRFYVPTMGMEAAISLIIPLIYTGKVKEKYKESIHNGCIEDKKNFINAFAPYLPSNKLNNIVKLVAEKEFHALEEQRKKILLSYILHNKFQSLSGIIITVVSYFQRFLSPSGIFIAVMGSDGSGKSSVISNLSESIKILYPKNRFIKLHWRPGVLPQIRTLLGKSKLENEFVIANPHSPKRRSRITSFLRWLYYLIDYIIGYCLKILPMKIKTTAVIMDRYYYDIIVDPIRYGFNLPKWLLILPLRFIPKPDLTIYLDNTPEELYKRKQELPIEELERQVKEWREFIPSLPNARIVTTDKPLDDVVNEVTRIVLERRAEMTRKILKIEPEASYYLWKTDITDYIALPSKKNCRWIIPLNPVLVNKSWDLYQPYSRTGRLFKSVMKFLSSNGFLKFYKFNKLNLELSDEPALLRRCIANMFKRDDFALALSTGTPGPFRKVTAMLMDSDGKVLGYVKIGETALAIERIKHEANILKLLVNSYQLSRGRGRVSEIRYPECLYEGEVGKAYVMIQTPAPFDGKSGGSEFNEDYAEVLNVIIKNTMVKKKFIDSEFYKNLKQGIETYPLSYRDILRDGLQCLEKSIGDNEIPFALSHGDFAPWNMLWNDKEVFLFDWESASFSEPAGLDLIHFLFQTGYLLKKLKGQKLLNFCTDDAKYKLSIGKIKENIVDAKTLFITYLLKMAIQEDKHQILSRPAVERRRLIMLIMNFQN